MCYSYNVIIWAVWYTMEEIMPELTTHYLFGKSVIVNFSPEISALIKNNLDAYNWGLQGPDLLFYTTVVRDSGRLARAGSALHHHNPEKVFSTMLEFILTYRNKPGYDSLCAYLYGFACHYALDSTIHPYVYSLAAKHGGKSMKTCHIQVESEIASLIYKRMTGMSVSSFKIYEHYTSVGAFVAPVSDLYVFLIKHQLGKSVSAKEVKSGFSLCLFLNYLTYLFARNELNNRIKTTLLKSTSALINQIKILSSFIKCDSVESDALNLMHNDWHNLCNPDKIFTYSVPEMFDIASIKSVDISHKCHDFLESGSVLPLGITESFVNGEPDKSDRNTNSKNN